MRIPSILEWLSWEGRVVEVLVHRVIELSSLLDPYFQLDIEQEAIRKPLLMKQKPQ